LSLHARGLGRGCPVTRRQGCRNRTQHQKSRFATRSGKNPDPLANGHLAEPNLAYADRLKAWADWQNLSIEAHGNLPQEQR
jgi:hypothetical protein